MHGRPRDSGHKRGHLRDHHNRHGDGRRGRRTAVRVDVADGRARAAVAQTVAGGTDAGAGEPGATRTTGRSARVQANRSVRRPDLHGRRHVHGERRRPTEHRVAAGQAAGRHPVAAVAHVRGGSLQQTKTARRVVVTLVLVRRRLSAHARSLSVRLQKARGTVVATLRRRRRPNPARRSAQSVRLVTPSPSQSPVAAHRAAQSYHAAAPAPGAGRLGRLLEDTSRPVADRRRPCREPAVHRVLQDGRRRDHPLPAQSRCA